jgi:Baseplate J-like protein
MECNTHNPLKRGGTSQRDRLLKSLDPSYVQVDERSLTDMVNYAIRYSEMLKYYDATNNVNGDGNWRVFLEQDITTLIAEMSGYKALETKTLFLSKIELLWQDAHFPPMSLLPLEDVFAQIFGLALTVDGWLQRTLPGTHLHREIQNAILPELRDALKKSIAYDKRAAFTLSGTYAVNDYAGLSSFWGITPAAINFMDYPDIYGAGTDEIKIKRALDPLGHGNADQNEFVNIFLVFFKHLARLSAMVPQFLEESLNSNEGHAPHTALLLTFLQLFRSAQGYMNTLTKRHLDFYYRSVLRLSEKEGIPDKVHVIFELAKGLNKAVVAKGAVLKDGKDALGKDVFFKAADDLVVTQAQITALKTFFIRKMRLLKPGSCTVIEKARNLYAAPIANSVDGQSEAFKANEKWPLLGETQHNKLIANRTMSDARLGFAFSSPLFFLNEGKRVISVRLKFDNNFKPAFWGPLFWDILGVNTTNNSPSIAQVNAVQELLAKTLQFRITGEKAWLTPDSQSVKINATQNTMEFELVYEGQNPPIVAYNASVHAETFVTQWPLLQIALDTTNFAEYYEYFRTLNLVFAQLEVCVTSMKTLNIQNDEGELDVRKPFLPFGQMPTPGSAFYIGNAEAFGKSLTSLRINVEWFDAPMKFADYYKDYKLTAQTSSPITANTDFTAKLDFLKDYYWKEVDYVTNFATPGPWKFALKLLPVPIPAITGAGAVLPYPSPNLQIGNGGVASTNKSSGPITAVSPVYGRPFGLHPGIGNFALNASGYLKHSPVTGLELFNATDARIPNTIKVMGTQYTANVAELARLGMPRDPSLRELDALQANPKQGYIRFQLNAPAFLHREYPELLSQKLFEEILLETAVEMVMDENGTNGSTTSISALVDGDGNPISPIIASTDVLNNLTKSITTKSLDPLQAPVELPTPYTPKIKSISLDYTSAVALDFSNAQSSGYYLRNTVDQVFHIHPFGQGQIQPVPEAQYAAASYRRPAKLIPTSSLLPQFTVDGKMIEGELYLGLQGMKAPETVAILVQLLEGSGDPDLEVPVIHWSYLSDNVWRSLEAYRIVADTTKGLTRSGIIRIDVPANATQDDQILPSGSVWLRVSVLNHSTALPFAISLATQAVLAVFDDQGNDPNRLRQALASNSIKSLNPKDFDIAKVMQPFAGFGGRHQEDEADFYLRVSERLRHKQRAINIWDYEHLVLENFPQLYKVKCSNHTSRISERAPGNVLVTVIPDQRNIVARNPLEPKVDVGTLGEIYQFLKRINPEFAILRVRNPRYERIKLKFIVYFKPGFDEGYYTQVLNTEIVQYLSPWAYDSAAEIAFGGMVYRSALLDFVEERDYVDYVTQFEMYHINGANIAQDVSVAEASTTDAVLVSVSVHEIITHQPAC